MIDQASEKYRRYVIGVSFGEMFFSLWGTDSIDDKDKLLLDLNNNVLCFKSIEILLRYLDNDSSNFFDKSVTQAWTKEYQIKEPYYVYDFSRILGIISSEEFNVFILSKNEASEIITYINLIGDYAYQIDDLKVFRFLEEDNTKKFFDYYYRGSLITYLWNNILLPELIFKESTTSIPFI